MGSILEEKWTDFYDGYSHTNVRTVNDHYVFTSGCDELRRYIIDLHNAKLEENVQSVGIPGLPIF